MGFKEFLPLNKNPNLKKRKNNGGVIYKSGLGSYLYECKTVILVSYIRFCIL